MIIKQWLQTKIKVHKPEFEKFIECYKFNK